ncbi:MAG: phospho-N-acetylmuramoyl-pentapeptide-transferase, partial [Chitinophagaceae bacterium]
MLYHLFEWFRTEGYQFPGSQLFQFITFRVMLAVILSLLISTLVGKKIINYLRHKQIGESVRDLGLAGEQQKKGTPTMGGIIIVLAILIPTLLLANLEKVYVRLMILSTVWLAIIGFVDDYLKLRSKKLALEKGTAYKKSDADGLAGRFKIFGQVMLGIIVGATLWFNPNVTTYREYQGSGTPSGKYIERDVNGNKRVFVETKVPVTTIPFVKSHEFNYEKLLPQGLRDYAWLLYILIVIFIITAVSNGSNITDGLDGLATGTSALVGV